MHHSRDFLINTTLASADTLAAGWGRSSSTAAADDMGIPRWNYILYLDQKLPSVGYTEICRSTARKWEEVLGYISLSKSKGGKKILFHSWFLKTSSDGHCTSSSDKLFLQVLVVLCFQPLSAFSQVNKPCWFTKPYLISYGGWNSFFLPSKWQSHFDSISWSEKVACSNHICLPGPCRKHQCFPLPRERLPNCRLISANSVQGVWGKSQIALTHAAFRGAVPDRVLGLRSICFPSFSPRKWGKWDSSQLSPAI